jgi:hypothetical protein
LPVASDNSSGTIYDLALAVNLIEGRHAVEREQRLNHVKQLASVGMVKAGQSSFQPEKPSLATVGCTKTTPSRVHDHQGRKKAANSRAVAKTKSATPTRSADATYSVLTARVRSSV